MINEGIQTESILEKVIESIQDKKGNNVLSLRFTEAQSSICDYFVICESTSEKHSQAISDFVQRNLRTDLGIRAGHIEGRETASWILLDFFDVIVHIFTPEARKFYNLEQLWADAEIVKYD